MQFPRSNRVAPRREEIFLRPNMSQSLPGIPPLSTIALSAQAGFRLKQIRERFGRTLGQGEEASLEIADAERSSEYVVSTARLNQIENDGSLPSIYKFYSLAVIYRLSIEEMMGLYGINLAKMEQPRHATQDCERRVAHRIRPPHLFSRTAIQLRMLLVLSTRQGSDPASPPVVSR